MVRVRGLSGEKRDHYKHLQTKRHEEMKKQVKSGSLWFLFARRSCNNGNNIELRGSADDAKESVKDWNMVEAQ